MEYITPPPREAPTNQRQRLSGPITTDYFDLARELQQLQQHIPSDSNFARLAQLVADTQEKVASINQKVASVPPREIKVTLSVIEQRVTKTSVNMKRLSNLLKRFVDEWTSTLRQMSALGTQEDAPMCPVCLQAMANPYILKCGHSFCKLCIDEVVNKTPISKPRCPTCRASFKLAIPNYALANIIATKNKK
jgi:hypothetical protein